MRRLLPSLRSVVVTIVSMAAIGTAWSQDGMTFKASMMLDVMYSMAADPIPGHARLYTTQPSRDREVGLVLGAVRVDGDAPGVRARLAVHTGWFPRVNYLGEDAEWRNLQEASIGVKLLDSVWLDAGIMPSHIGYESMTPRNNAVLSRSLTADYTPYYETGAMLTWRPSDVISISGLVLTGWQQIVDVNSDLSFGSRIAFTPLSDVTISWSTYVGNDQPSPLRALLRVHNNMWVEWKPTSDITLVVLGDLCLQERRGAGNDRQWYAGGIAAWRAWEGGNIAVRAERYDDRDRMFIVTPTGDAARITGVSANIDHAITSHVTARFEARRFNASAPIFVSDAGPRRSELFFTLSISTLLGAVY